MSYWWSVWLCCWFSDVDSEQDGNESEESFEETAQEKRLRLAKEYLAKLEQEGMAFENYMNVKTILNNTTSCFCTIFQWAFISKYYLLKRLESKTDDDWDVSFGQHILETMN